MDVDGAAYAFSPRFTTGLELRNHNEIEQDPGDPGLEWKNSALFLGPSISYTSRAWALTFSVMPQLPAPKTESNSVLDLHDHEMVDARLHLAVHF